MNKLFIAKRSRAPIALPLLVCLAGTSGLAYQDAARAATTQEAADGAIVPLKVGRPLRVPFGQGATYKIEEGSDLVRGEVVGETLSVYALKPGQATLLVQTPGKADQRTRIRIAPSSPLSAAPSPLAAAPASAPVADIALSGSSSFVDKGLPPGFTSPVTPTVEPMMQVSSNLPQPSRLPSGSAPYPTNPSNDKRASAIHARRDQSRDSIPPITQGLARLLQFNSNILAVFFSDVNVMDARAVTARTIAVTGMAPGKSTLAVFVSRYQGDAVGQAMIYNITVEPQTPQTATPPTQDPSVVETAIRTALSDPRIQVSVIRTPSGSLAARLTGSVRDAQEVAAAVQTARLFVSEVIPGIVQDPYAPSLAQALTPQVSYTTEGVWQQKLRHITGNDTIELVPLPTGLAVKAEVDSTADADALLGLLPALNQRVLPFIVVRGGATGTGGMNGADSRYYGSERPILTGENAEITRQMHEVTGIRTVYAVRTAQNALAVYGTVRNRTEYDTIRRYALLLPQVAPQTSMIQRTTTTPIPGQTFGGVNVPGAGPAVGGPAMRPLMSPQLAYQPQFGASAQVVPGAGATGGAAGGATGAPGTVTTPPGLPALPTTGTTGNIFPNQSTGTNVPGAGGNNTGVSPGGIAAPFAGGVPMGAPGSTSSSVWSMPEDLAGAGAVGGQAPGAVDPTTALNAQPANANQPHSGYHFPNQIQMFVRVLDEEGNMVRRVMAETSIVEIRRDALRNLGVQGGSVQILSQTITPATANSPEIIQRTIDPTLRQGLFTGGNGFVGLEKFNILDPLRAQVNALYQKGDARILSQPNLTAVEGADAQIVIGGERPVPSSVASGAGAIGQSVTFRRFGIILTMRPTVTDDDTIIMQIRADITSLDPSSSITLNGSVIPGESVRSINTTLTVREGDILVMGGIITNDRREETSRIPILSSIPILGNLFKSRRFENNETELAIVMTPRILRTPVSTNTKEAIQRIPALPELPSNQEPQGIFDFGAQAGVGQ